MNSTVKLLILSHLIVAAVFFFIGRASKQLPELELVSEDTTSVVIEVDTDTTIIETDSVTIDLPIPEPEIITIGRDYALPPLREDRNDSVIPAQPENEDSLTVNRYHTVYKDSLIDASFQADVLGSLVDWDFTYKLTYPQITNTIKETVTITRVERIKPRPFLFVAGELRLPFGGGVAFNPIGGFTTSKGQSIFYKYDAAAPKDVGRHWIGASFPVLRF